MTQNDHNKDLRASGVPPEELKICNLTDDPDSFVVLPHLSQQEQRQCLVYYTAVELTGRTEMAQLGSPCLLRG